MERLKRVVPTKWLLVVLAVAAGVPTPTAGQDDAPPRVSPLAFFEPFMGPWVAHPDWEPIADDPALAELVPLNFRWGPAKQSIRFCEGLPRALGEHDACGLVVWNASTLQAEFRAFQVSGSLVFDGYYEMAGADTMRRIYDVIRPDGSVDRYRETFVLSRPDLIDWRTDRFQDGEWVQRRPDGPFFQAIRPARRPTDNLMAFARLIGDWYPDPERTPEAMRKWGEENGVTGVYTSFRWGTNQRWIEFGDHRRTDEWRQEGAGLIAWDPGRQRVTYREHTESETSLEGVLVVVDDLTWERHYTVFRQNGDAQRWIDRWRWVDPDEPCFEWTTIRVEGADRESWDPYWLCKR